MAYTGETTTKNGVAYEIYTKGPAGESGWDIKLVLSTPERIKTYPGFDCIITIGQCSPDEVH